GQPVLAASGGAAAPAAAGATQAMAATQAVRGYEPPAPADAYPVGYEEPRRSGAFLVVLILLLLILAGLLFALGKVLTNSSNNNAQTIDISVPTGGVVGKTEDEATNNLKTAGFDVTAAHDKN